MEAVEPRRAVLVGRDRFGSRVLAAAVSMPVWVLAAIAFVAGPVVLASLWRFTPHAGRGLTDFWSATAGDWLLLPLIVALSALALRDLAALGLARLGAVTRWVPIAWALLSTILLNVVWLSDAGNANWTQPLGPGPFGLALTLNLAGWLHAVFFVAMQWWIAEFVLRLVFALLAIRRGDLEVTAERTDAVASLFANVNWVLIACFVFGILLARDYWGRILNPSLSQTWAWVLIPLVVLALSAVINDSLLCWLDGVSSAAQNGSSALQVRESQVIIWWSIALALTSIAIIAVTGARVFESFGLLPLSSVALAGLGSANIWAEVYYFQRGRKPDAAGVLGMTSAGLLMLGGFFVSLYMVAGQSGASSLDGIIIPWLFAFGIAMASCAGAAGLGVLLAAYERHKPEWQKTLDQAQLKVTHFGEVAPENDILQNIPQYGLLHGLLPLFAAAYLGQAVPLMVHGLDVAEALSTQVSLLFGYAGVVVAAVTFPLYNNMAYVRGLEEQLKQKKAEATSAKGETKRDGMLVAEYLDADKTFTSFLNIAVGAIAALAAMWMWIQVLDVALGLA